MTLGIGTELKTKKLEHKKHMHLWYSIFRYTAALSIKLSTDESQNSSIKSMKIMMIF